MEIIVHMDDCIIQIVSDEDDGNKDTRTILVEPRRFRLAERLIVELLGQIAATEPWHVSVRIEDNRPT